MTAQSPDDYVAFRIGNIVSRDLRLLVLAAVFGQPVQWYTRTMMAFMAACGPQWKPFSTGTALEVMPGSLGEATAP